MTGKETVEFLRFTWSDAARQGSVLRRAAQSAGHHPSHEQTLRHIQWRQQAKTECGTRNGWRAAAPLPRRTEHWHGPGSEARALGLDRQNPNTRYFRNSDEPQYGGVRGALLETRDYGQRSIPVLWRHSTPQKPLRSGLHARRRAPPKLAARTDY